MRYRTFGQPPALRVCARLLVGIAFIVVGGAGLGADPAGAAPTGPTSASALAIGTPLSEFIPRSEYYHWLRLPQRLRNADQTQIAVTLSDGARLCLTGPADDFDELRLEQACNDAENEDGPHWSYAAGGSSRQTLTWRGSPAAEYLVVKDNAGFGVDYSLTVERIVERVNIGFPSLTSTSRRVNLKAITVYGDNQPAADGIAGQLIWRRLGGSAWKVLSKSTVLGGRIAFTGKLPRSRIGRRVVLRACVAQPGSDKVRCATRKMRVTRG